MQQTADIIPDKLTLRGGIALTGTSGSGAKPIRTLGVPGQDIPVSDTTFNASGVYAVTPNLTSRCR